MGLLDFFKKKSLQQQPVSKIEPRSALKATRLLDSIIIDGEDCDATYKYTDIKMYRHDCDVSQLTLYKKLSLRQEPENEYDSNAIALYDDNIKIGYLFKGHLQDMANDWMKKDEPIRAMVSRIDNEEIYIDLYFYEIPSKHLSTWANKIVTLNGNKSEEFQDNICFIEEDNRKLDLEYDYDKEQYLISDGSLDIGYIPKNFEGNPTACFLEKISENSSGKYTVKVKVYFK